MPKNEAVAIKRGTGITIVGKFNVGEPTKVGQPDARSAAPLLLAHALEPEMLLLYCDDCAIVIGEKRYKADARRPW